MRIGDFDFYRDFLRKKAGLALTANKSTLLNARLTPVSKKWGYPSLEAMTLALRGVADPKLIRDVIEAMVDDETAFFREPEAFRRLQEVAVPRLLKKRKKKSRLRIWSVGCAGGQEAWSIAVALREMKPTPLADILASDMSETLLARALLGEYSQFEAQRGMPMPLLMKYFDPHPGDGWKAGAALRRMVTFRAFNLMDKPPKMEPCDVIFCCRVLEGFDDEAKRQALAGLAKTLAPDGILFLGEGEIIETGESFIPLEGSPGLYIQQNDA